MSKTKSCPVCRLANPLGAGECHCGYLFARSDGMQSPEQKPGAFDILGRVVWVFMLVGIVGCVLSFGLAWVAESLGPNHRVVLLAVIIVVLVLPMSLIVGIHLVRSLRLNVLSGRSKCVALGILAVAALLYLMGLTFAIR